VWGYQRDLTKSRYMEGSTPGVANPVWVISAPFEGHPHPFYFLDPNSCGTVTSQFGGSVSRQTRPDQGDSCGTFNAGYYTLGNENQSMQGYVHATMDFSREIQLYVDALISHQSDKYGVGLPFVTTNQFPDGVIYEPNVDAFVFFQHVFSPGEIGGLQKTLNSADTDTWRATLRANGKLGDSGWSYDVGYTYVEQKLAESVHQLLAIAVDNFFNGILGPNLGPTQDPNGVWVSTRQPDYLKFYSPASNSQYSSIDTLARSDSLTENGMFRAQLSSTALFELAGGPAGIAIAAEAGHEEWRYSPDPRYLTGEFFEADAV